MPESDESEYFTLVFKGDIRAFSGNPFKTETPFGVPLIVSVGDVVAECDRLQARDLLLGEAIQRAIWIDWSWHSNEGLGDYKMDRDLAALVRRAREMGVDVPPPYSGFDFEAALEHQ